jgi:putative transposase
MARPLRIEFPGALYHETSRGDGREDIYLEEGDRQAWLGILGAVCERFPRSSKGTDPRISRSAIR